MSEQNRRASDSPESREKQGEIDKEIVKDGLGQPSISLDKEDLEKQLIQDIENYYHRWLSTVNRKTQLFSNLKLGFALLFALPLFFMVQGVATLWGNSWVKGMTFFALGTTFVELNDFFKSQFFDDVRAFKKRESRGKFHDIFPAPASRGWYIALWLLNLTISIAIAQWPKVAPILCKFLQGFYR
jgi:hypothetical protein